MTSIRAHIPSGRRWRRLVAASGAALLTAAGLSANLVPAKADSQFSFIRFAGADRYDTARLIAVHDFGTGAQTVLLARAEAGGPTADALAGSYLAGFKHAPILLTDPNTVPTATDEALRTLNARNVIILGGTAAVSSAVATHLTTEGYLVSRVSGTNRYDTARQVAMMPSSGYVATIDGKKSAFLANAVGNSSPDALAAAPASFAGAIPTLLTTTDVTPQETLQALRDLGVTQIYLTGGEAVISANQEAALKDAGYTTQRLAGANRAATAVAVATGIEINKLGFGVTHVNLARGDDAADALAGGPHAGLEKASLQLTLDTCTLDDASTGKFLRDNANTLGNGNIFGGSRAVCQAVEDTATTDAGGPTGLPPQASPGTFGTPAGTTPAVTRLDKNASWFVLGTGSTAATYYYRSTDTFQLVRSVMGVAACTPDTFGDFVSRISAGDAVSGTYAPSGTSTFCLNDQAPAAPLTVTATAAAPGVTLSWADSATPSTTSYAIARAPLAAPALPCPPVGQVYLPVATVIDKDPTTFDATTTYSYTDTTALTAATYCYSVSAIDVTGSTGSPAFAGPVSAG